MTLGPEFDVPPGDPDALEAAARKVNGVGATLGGADARSARSGMVTALSGWSGPRRDDFDDAGAGAQIHLKTFGATLQGIHDALKKYASALRTAQDDVKACAKAVHTAQKRASDASTGGVPDTASMQAASRALTTNSQLADDAQSTLRAARRTLQSRLHDLAAVLVPGTSSLSDADVQQKVLSAFHQTGLPADGVSTAQAWDGLVKARQDSPDDAVNDDGTVDWAAWVADQTDKPGASGHTTLWNALHTWDLTPAKGENPADYYAKKLGLWPSGDGVLDLTGYSSGLVGAGAGLTKSTSSRFVISRFAYRQNGRYARLPSDLSRLEHTKILLDESNWQAAPYKAATRTGVLKWSKGLGKAAGAVGAVATGGIDAYTTWQEDKDNPNLTESEKVGRATGAGIGGGGGAIAGAWAGGEAGAAIGTFVGGPVGTVVGGVVGAAIGGFVGSSAGEHVGKWVGDLGGKAVDAAKDLWHGVFG